MAYVNMTVDGQTKRTSQLNLKGADGNTKTALLSAVLEASDVSQGGSSALGEFTKYKAVEFSNSASANGKAGVYKDFGEDGIPDLLVFESNEEGVGFISGFVLLKSIGAGGSIGKNAATGNNTITGYFFIEDTTITSAGLYQKFANARCGYYENMMYIGQASTNVTFNPDTTYVIDCYWK